MEWILEKLPILIFVVVFIGQIVRGLKRSRAVKPAPPPRGDSLDEMRRAQEVQAEIRRKIAERRSGPFREAVPEPRDSQTPPVVRPTPPVVVQRDPTAIPDPFGGPIKRMLEELERRAQPAPPRPVPAAPPVLANRNAELERQEQLAEEIRVLDETRMLVERRARKAANAKVVEAGSMPALRTAARGRLMADLHDRESVKRAFVLREVLGAPVGLR